MRYTNHFSRGWGLVFLIAAGPVLSAELPAHLSQLGWVGLYNQELLEWLENENRLAEICPESLAEERLQRCTEQSLQAKSVTLTVHKQPSADSPILGGIVITATPGQGFSLIVQQGKHPLPWTPDIYDTDWGYGPYIHQTYSARQGSWFLLPKEPLSEAGWVDMSTLSEEPEVLNLNQGAVYALDGASIVIIKIERDAVMVRPEQAADMWCDEGEPPPLKPTAGRRVVFSDLLDKNGHLKLKIKYLRGC